MPDRIDIDYWQRKLIVQTFFAGQKFKFQVSRKIVLHGKKDITP